MNGLLVVFMSVQTLTWARLPNISEISDLSLNCFIFQIVEFMAVLLKSGNEVAEKELVSSGTIQRVLDLFFE